MTNIRMASLVSLLALLLFSGCNQIADSSSKNSSNADESSNLSIDNNNAPKINLFKGFFQFDVSVGAQFEPLTGITAIDTEDGDITSSITYEIYDMTLELVLRTDYIDLGSAGYYRIDFSVIDSGGREAIETMYAQVGNPSEIPPDPTTCHGAKKDYSYVKSELDWQLSWSEEFDYVGPPNPAVWTYEYGTGNNGWGNEELQYYTGDKKNSYVENGKLRITLLKEKKGAKDYTSARIITKGKKTFKYGKIVTRAKIPSGKGTWPAIWLLGKGKYGGWPHSGEIDIMESVGFEANKVHSTIHTELFNGGNKKQKGWSVLVNNLYADYHDYIVEWYPDRIDFYVDTTFIYSYSPEDFGQTCPTEKYWPFDDEFFMILNIAYGGLWGGAKGIDDTIFNGEVSMYIESIKYYEAAGISKYK